MLTTIGAAPTWRVESAGTWVSQSLPPTPEAIEEAEKRNLDITAHLSRSINETLLSQADLILVMESGQKEALTNEFPEIKRKSTSLPRSAEDYLIIFRIPTSRTILPHKLPEKLKSLSKTSLTVFIITLCKKLSTLTKPSLLFYLSSILNHFGTVQRKTTKGN